MSILIKNGRVVTAVDDTQADVYIEGEQVKMIGRDLPVTADLVIDATDRLVIPGGVDPHTHFDLPSMGTVSADDFESGTRAAANGGTTCIIDFPTQSRGRSTLEALETWHEKAAGKACIDYGFHMIVTDMPEERLPEMTRLVEEGLPSFKMFMAYPNSLYSDDGTLYRAFRQAGLDGAIMCMHAENGIVIDEIVKQAIKEGHTEPKYHALTRPPRMEGEAVHRAIAIAEVADVPIYIVHMSCADAVDELRRARERGVVAYGETCPQYLFLDASCYQKPDFEAAKYIMTPVLREKWNQEALWKGLKLGDLQTVGTDHCPFCFKGQKEMGRDDFRKVPNGAPGVENRMSLMFNGGVVQGRIGLNKFVELTSTAAAKIFGLFPRKGTIAPGSDADIVVFDPTRKETISVSNPRTHTMRVDYSAYEGLEVQGHADVVISRGRVIVDHHRFVGSTGAGRFIKRARYGELLR